MYRFRIILYLTLNMKHLFFLLLFFISSIAFSQEVTGIIVDQEGKPLEGVNIYLSSIEKGSISDINGKYNISVLSVIDWYIICITRITRIFCILNKL